MQSPDAIAAMTPVVAELERLGVPYYVGGSLASTAYGCMRITLNVDLVADLASEHVNPLVETLQGTYYADAKIISEAITRKSYFNLIHLATSFKVDIFAVKDREYDRRAFERIQKRSIDKDDPSVQFFLASAEDIVLSKLEWLRLGDEVSERQWGDVIGVLKVQQNSLDRPYLDKWAAELGIADLLDKAFNEAET